HTHRTHTLNLSLRLLKELSRPDTLDRFRSKAQSLKLRARRPEDRLRRPEAFQQLRRRTRPDARRHVKCDPLSHIADCGLRNAALKMRVFQSAFRNPQSAINLAEACRNRTYLSLLSQSHKRF